MLVTVADPDDDCCGGCRTAAALLQLTPHTAPYRAAVASTRAAVDTIVDALAVHVAAVDPAGEIHRVWRLIDALQALCSSDDDVPHVAACSVAAGSGAVTAVHTALGRFGGDSNFVLSCARLLHRLTVAGVVDDVSVGGDGAAEAVVNGGTSDAAGHVQCDAGAVEAEAEVSSADSGECGVEGTSSAPTALPLPASGSTSSTLVAEEERSTIGGDPSEAHVCEVRPSVS